MIKLEYYHTKLLKKIERVVLYIVSGGFFLILAADGRKSTG